MVVTQDFGAQPNEQAQVVGVAYNDTQGTGSYQPGEGVGNVQITAVNLQTGAGQLDPDLGLRRLRAGAGPGPVSAHRQPERPGDQLEAINVSNVNVEQDFDLTERLRRAGRSRTRSPPRRATPSRRRRSRSSTCR